VNFGTPLCDSTRNAIQHRLPGRVCLEGVGFDEAASYPLPTPCEFNMMIPANYIYGDTISNLGYRIPVRNLVDDMSQDRIQLP